MRLIGPGIAVNAYASKSIDRADAAIKRIDPGATVPEVRLCFIAEKNIDSALLRFPGCAGTELEIGGETRRTVSLGRGERDLAVIPAGHHPNWVVVVLAGAELVVNAARITEP